MQSDVTVTQADRDAAAKYVREGKGRFAEYTAGLIERGEHDSDLVFAFARQRLAALAAAQGEPVAAQDVAALVERIEQLDLLQETNLPNGEWDLQTFRATLALCKRHLSAALAKHERTPHDD